MSPQTIAIVLVIILMMLMTIDFLAKAKHIDPGKNLSEHDEARAWKIFTGTMLKHALVLIGILTTIFIFFPPKY